MISSSPSSSSSSSNLVTFVTAYLDIYEKQNEQGQDIEYIWRKEYFLDLVKTGIQIAIFIDQKHWKDMMNLQQIYSNLTILGTITKEMLPFVDDTYHVPKDANVEKDTKEFLLFHHCKPKWMEQTIVQNPFGSTHFGWIDFNLPYIFKHKTQSLQNIKLYAQMGISIKTMFAIPGCRHHSLFTTMEECCQRPHWYYCGGIFIGDQTSILTWCKLCTFYFPIFLELYHTIVWDFQFWAWLHKQQLWNPQRYLIDSHDDTILQIPMKYQAICLSTYMTKTIQYEYPICHGYIPMNASYLESHGKKYLITRYVNYQILKENGNYVFFHVKNIIMSKNVCSMLDENYQLISSTWLQEDQILEQSTHPHFRGLEDIRIFAMHSPSIISFLATTTYLHTEGKSGMVYGTYDMSGHILDLYPISSPYHKYCEKNWCPIDTSSMTSSSSSSSSSSIVCIYQWFPFEIIQIEIPLSSTMTTTTTTTIIPTTIAKFEENLPPLFSRLRGSTRFQEYSEFPNCWVGLAHFSDETRPREYYHVLVILDKLTYRPMSHSIPFYFHQIGIEICDGFSINHGNAYFWISQFDCNPEVVCLPLSHIPFQLL
jgi:hypothetical protein